MLPAGFAAEKIVVNRYNPVTYTLDKPIIQIQRAYPFSLATKRRLPEKPNTEIYESPLPYPQITDNGLITSFLSGQPIAFSAISPFAYYPLTNELIFYRELSVEISYSNSVRAIEAMRFLKQDSFTASRLQKLWITLKIYELLSLVKRELNILLWRMGKKIAQWTPLKTFQETRGKTVLIKSISEITTENQGADT